MPWGSGPPPGYAHGTGKGGIHDRGRDNTSSDSCMTAAAPTVVVIGLIAAIIAKARRAADG